MFDHRTNRPVLDKMFAVVQILLNTIRRDRTRCPNGKIFGHQTVFDLVCGQTFPVWSGTLTERLTRGKILFSGCSSALGIASGEIKDYQLTASSSYSDSQPYQARPSKHN